MKKMLLATALALLITGCSTDVYHSKNKPAAVAPKETITIISSFLELGEENCRCNTKFVALRNVVKTAQQTFVVVARFY